MIGAGERANEVSEPVRGARTRTEIYFEHVAAEEAIADNPVEPARKHLKASSDEPAKGKILSIRIAYGSISLS